ncbi:MAG: FAD:protein FMN transferase [Planctomycetaceae bacterium]
MSYALVVGLMGVVLAQPASPAAEQRHEFDEQLMGMSFRIVVYSADPDTANRAARRAFERIQQLNDVLSDYQEDSELSLLGKTSGSGTAVPLSHDLERVLRAACNLADQTKGAFDPTVGPLTRLWRRTRRSRQLPQPEVLAKARERVGHRHLELAADRPVAELKVAGMQLDLGGIAVGYAIDRAMETLAAEGIRSALIDGSGDILVSAPPPGSEGWRIGVAPLEPEAPPSQYLLLKHAAVTTSGDAFQYVEIGGQRYSHIVDPQTGLGLTSQLSATVIASDCTQADSLATAVCVLGTKAGLELIANTPKSAALVMQRTARGTETATSPDWRRWVLPAPAPGEARGKPPSQVPNRSPRRSPSQSPVPAPALEPVRPPSPGRQP